MGDYDRRLAQAQDFAAGWQSRALAAEAERDRLRDERARIALAVMSDETADSADGYDVVPLIKDVVAAAAEGDEIILRLIAERDRLRAVVERAHDHVGVDEHVLRSLATDDLVALVGVLRHDCRDAVIENDRLRAVVRKLSTATALSSDDRSVYERALQAPRPPMDEHEHYGPGQPMNAADVAALLAERDRLRAALEVLTGCQTCGKVARLALDGHLTLDVKRGGHR